MSQFGMVLPCNSSTAWSILSCMYKLTWYLPFSGWQHVKHDKHFPLSELKVMPIWTLKFHVFPPWAASYLLFELQWPETLKSDPNLIQTPTRSTYVMTTPITLPLLCLPDLVQVNTSECRFSKWSDSKYAMKGKEWFLSWTVLSPRAGSIDSIWCTGLCYFRMWILLFRGLVPFLFQRCRRTIIYIYMYIYI